VLLECHAHHLHCGACCHAIKLVAKHLSHHIAASGDTWGTADALNQPRLSDHRGKNLAHDTDYLRSLRETVMRRRRCTSLTTLAEHKGATSSSTHHWKAKGLGAYQIAGWRSFCPAPAGAYVLQEDGAKIGQPAVEMQTYIMQHVASNQSMVLPPQALR
jgi:hypothetical protein